MILAITVTRNAILPKTFLEALSFAAETGNELHALVMGEASDPELKRCGLYGCTRVFHYRGFLPVAGDVPYYAGLIQAFLKDKSYSGIILGASGLNNSLAPYLAAKLNAGFVGGTTGYPVSLSDRKSVV